MLVSSARRGTGRRQLGGDFDPSVLWSLLRRLQQDVTALRRRVFSFSLQFLWFLWYLFLPIGFPGGIGFYNLALFYLLLYFSLCFLWRLFLRLSWRYLSPKTFILQLIFAFNISLSASVLVLILVTCIF